MQLEDKVEIIDAEIVSVEEVVEQNGEESLPVQTERVEERAIVEDKKSKKKKKTATFDGDFSAFYELALLLNKSVEDVKDECCLYQLRKLMAKTGKVIVRYDIEDKELEKVLLNANGLCLDEILIAPLHIESMRKSVKKHDLENQKVGVIINFPFGEDTLKAKLVSVNEAKRGGVDSVTVMMPTALLKEDKKREFVKQLKKIARAFNGEKGIAVSAGDLSTESIELAVKLVEKTKLNFLTLIFGDSTGEQALVEKMKAVNSVKHSKKIKVLGNVETAGAMIELYRANVDIILTPYADDIGKELVDRFKIKSLKLV